MNISTKYARMFPANRSINYTDIDLLTQYLTEQGKILPKRITGLNTKQQKKSLKALKELEFYLYCLL